MKVSEFLKRMSLGRLKDLIRVKRRQEMAEKLERVKDRLLKRVSQLRTQIGALLDGGGRARKIANPNTMSAATRKKLSVALKAYWAGKRKQKGKKAKPTK